MLNSRPFQDSSLSSPKSFTKPGWFTQPIPFGIYKPLGADRWAATLDITSYKITPTNTYYVSTTGSSGNDGSTPSTPKRDVDQAIALGNASGAPYEIRIAEGTYNRNSDWSNSPTQDCNIIGEGAGAVLSAQEDGLTFTLTSSNTYSTSRSAVASVYDHNYLDGNGNAQRLRQVTTQAACEAEAGTWAQVGSTLYVHAFDERNLSSSLGGMKVYLRVNSPKVVGAVTCYVENIDIEGFQTTCFEARTSLPSQVAKLYFNNVSLKYCYNGNGMSLLGVTEFIGKNVTTAHNWSDGLNYHIRDGILPNAYEVDCTHIDNGMSGATNTNSTTMHDGGSIVRVNVYASGASKLIHDVDAGTKVLNIGCETGRSRGNDDQSSSGFVVGDGTGETITGLYDCTTGRSECNYDWICDVNSTLYIDNNLFNSTKSIADGTVTKV